MVSVLPFGIATAGLMPDNKNAVIWIGTESGHAPYPVWSTQTGCASGAGSATGESYVPKEVDLTLQNSDTSVLCRPPLLHYYRRTGAL